MEEKYIVKITEQSNGTDRVFIPVLTDEERAKRQEQLMQAAIRFMKAVERAKKEGE